MRFKNWIQVENLAGPGGGPGSAEDQEALAKNIAAHGAGAFPTGGDNPPPVRRTATSGYESPEHRTKYMDVERFQNRTQYSDEKPQDVKAARWNAMLAWKKKREEEKEKKKPTKKLA